MENKYNIPCEPAASGTAGSNESPNRMDNAPVKDMNSKNIPLHEAQPGGNARMRHIVHALQTQSIEDNTHVGQSKTTHGSQNVQLHQATLQVAERFLETFRTAIMTKLNDTPNETSSTCTDKHLTDSMRTDTSETPLKQAYRRSSVKKTTVTRTSSISSTTTSSSNNRSTPDGDESDLYSKRIQIGNENVMLVCEPRESKTKQVFKQVGDKNIIVNIQILSNTCQLMDLGGNIIPLDSEGEVWLEIKRRGKNTNGDGQTPTTSGGCAATCDTMASGRNFTPPSGSRRSITENSDYSTIDLVTTQAENNPVTSNEQHSPTATNNRHFDGEFVRHATNAHNGDSATKSTVEHSFSMWRENTRISETSDMLSLKHENYNHRCSLMDRNSVDEREIIDAMLNHEKVVDFILNEGNDFNVSICQWDYETEQKHYSYAEHNEPRNLDEDDYDAVPVPPTTQLQRRPMLGAIRRQSAEDESSTHPDPRENEAPLAAQTKPALPPRDINLVGQPSQSTVPINTGCSGTLSPGALTHKTPAAISPPPWSSGPRLLQQAADVRRNPPPLHSYVYPTNTPGPTTPDITSLPPIPERWKYEITTPASTEESAPGVICRTREHQSSRKYMYGDVSPYRPWYHGNLSRDESVERLRNTLQERPLFLVRDASNQSSSHKYTLDIAHEGEINKLKIMQTSDGGYQFEAQSNRETNPAFQDGNRMIFDTLDDLINAVIKNGIAINASDLDMKTIIVTPLTKTSSMID